MTMILYGDKFAKLVGITLFWKGSFMLKFFLLLSFLLTSVAGLASPMDQAMTMKERLRLSFWVEGIQSQSKQKAPAKQILPEEIERPLRKL